MTNPPNWQPSTPPSGPPAPYGWSAPAGPAYQAAPPPAPKKKRNGGKIAAIVLAIVLPILAICGVAGYFVVKGAAEGVHEVLEDLRTPPAAGTCLRFDTTPSRLSWSFNDTADNDTKVACTEDHHVEVVSSGTLATRPGLTSPETHDLYQQCSTAADDYLGTTWVKTDAWLLVSVPSPAEWDLGAHWYRCDVYLKTTNYITAADEPRVLRTTLRDAGPEPITCVSWDAGTDLDNKVAVDCTVAHPGEIAAILPMLDDVDWTDRDAVSDAVNDLCDPYVLAFLAVTELPQGLDYWYTWPDEDWLDQWVTCTVTGSDLDTQFSGSLEGIGTGTLPVV